MNFPPTFQKLGGELGQGTGPTRPTELGTWPTGHGIGPAGLEPGQLALTGHTPGHTSGHTPGETGLVPFVAVWAGLGSSGPVWVSLSRFQRDNVGNQL